MSCHQQGTDPGKPDRGLARPLCSLAAGFKTINMVTPIYNESSCSNASCHAHRASTKVLGVLDVALRLDPVQKQNRAVTLQTMLLPSLEVTIGAAFVILFTRRFVAKPIQQLIEGTKTVSAMHLDRPIEITPPQPGTRRIGGFVQCDARAPEIAVDELNEMQQTLESKVDERTAQLHAAQRKLLQSDRLAPSANWRPASLTRSIIPFPACSTSPCCSSA